MTGHGAGRALSNSRHGRIQAAYDRLLNLMERRGSLTLFVVASVVNPFFYPAALAAGALRFGLKKYIPIVLAGKTNQVHDRGLCRLLGTERPVPRLIGISL